MGKTLSDQAIIDIKRMKADLRRLMVAAGLEDNTLQTGPPHYLVLTPTGGIDAVDGDGIPGEAECQISRRWGTVKDIQDTALKVKVYNHTEQAIAEGVHIIVHRDAWGDYYVGDSSGAGATCELIGLAPGVYAGVAGASFTAGEEGPVQVGALIFDAVNQSECDVNLGDKIVVGISPDCDPFFTPCSCCDPVDCCDRKIAICICGDQQLLAVDGGTYEWDVSSCCQCEGATLTITLSCVTTTITADWEYVCGETNDSGSVDLSSLCSESDVTISGQISITGCELGDRYSNYLATCDEPVFPSCENDCTELLTSYTNDFVWQTDSTHTFSIPLNGWCPGETRRVSVRGYSVAGIAGDVWPGWSGSGQFGGPGSFATGLGFPWIRVSGQGGGVRITAASHSLATVTQTTTTTTSVSLPYTLPSTGAQTANLAFDIPRVNYDNAFDYTVWVDIELIDTTVVCGSGSTRTFIGIEFGTWIKSTGPNNFQKWHIGGTNWNAGYGCDCP